MSKIINDGLTGRMLYSCTHMAIVGVNGLGTGSRSNILVKFLHFRRLRCGHRSPWFKPITSAVLCYAINVPVVETRS